MLSWLEQDLAANSKEWLIAFWHSPPYSKGSHNSDFELNLVQMRERVVPVLESYGIDLVLCGHSHSYERSYLLDGHYGPSGTLTPTMILDGGGGRPEEAGAYVKPPSGPSAHQGAVYVVAGSAGQTSGGALNHPAMFISLNRLGSVVIDIDGDRLDAKFLRENGAVEDQFTILKAPQPPTIVAGPASQSAVAGSTVMFEVEARGTPPLAYQWFFNGEALADGTNVTLTLQNVQEAAEGIYAVTVSNALGVATSGEAVLTVNVRPTYDLSRDFSLAENPSGAWSYGYSMGLGGAFNLLLFPKTSFYDNLVPVQSWQLTAGNGPAVYRNSSSTSAIAGGGQAVLPPGVMWFHAGDHGRPENFGVIRLTIPEGSDGAYRIDSSFARLFDGSLQGDTDIHVLVNGREVFGQFLPADTTGGGYTEIETLAGGETVDFVIGRGQDGNVSGSALKIQATLTLVSSNAVAPIIRVQPSSLTVTLGQPVNFSVVAVGSQPLSYQWLFDGSPLADATNATLTLAGAQFSDAGQYAVVVSNAGGSVSSSPAVLTVTYPPATVRVVSLQASAGAPLSVPVELLANGNENALGFSLNFDAALLSFDGADLGLDAPSSAVLVVNPNDADSGRVGLAIALAADVTFPFGTQQIARVHFTVAPAQSPVTAPVTFGDLPTARQISDREARPQPAAFLDGAVSVAAVDFEGDVAPRPGGDRSLTIIDWVQLGRFVAGLEPISSANEFQRADCAPQSQRGNGVLGVTDWVQAGRYAAGLDPLTPAGGPSGEGGAPAIAGLKPPHSSKAAATRAVRLMDAHLLSGTVTNVPVKLEAQGDENALGFSVSFDPAKLHLVGTLPGEAAVGAVLNVNTNQLAAGRVGVALAMAAGGTFEAGSQELVVLRFSAEAGTAGGTALEFGDSPVRREVSDAEAESLAVSYTGATVMVVQPGPTLGHRVSGRTLVLFWPVAGSDGFELETSPVVTGGSWTKVDASPIVIGDHKLITILMREEEEAYFRLRKQ
jgi:hypothetical protein